MKSKHKFNFKRIVSIVFTLLLTIQSFGVPQTVLANDWYRTLIVNQDKDFYIKGSNPDGKPFLANQENNYFGVLYSFDVPGNTSGSTGWNVAFCIEPLVSTNNGEVYPAPIPISSYSKITAKMQKELGLIGHYGYHISPTQKNRQFTQMLIWEHRGATLEAIRYKDVDVMSEYKAFKSNVMFHVNSHVIKPSFNNQTYTVNAGESITITDTNGYFKDFTLVDTGSFSLNHNGNSLTITASKTANDNTITFRKLANHNLETALIYSDPTRQDIGILNDIATQDSEHIQVDNNPLQIEVIK